MGAAASISVAIDLEAAKAAAGDKFDQAKWDAATKDADRVSVEDWNAAVRVEASPLRDFDAAVKPLISIIQIVREKRTNPQSEDDFCAEWQTKNAKEASESAEDYDDRACDAYETTITSETTTELGNAADMVPIFQPTGGGCFTGRAKWRRAVTEDGMVYYDSAVPLGRDFENFHATQQKGKFLWLREQRIFENELPQEGAGNGGGAGTWSVHVEIDALCEGDFCDSHQWGGKGYKGAKRGMAKKGKKVAKKGEMRMDSPFSPEYDETNTGAWAEWYQALAAGARAREKAGGRIVHSTRGSRVFKNCRWHWRWNTHLQDSVEGAAIPVGGEVDEAAIAPVYAQLRERFVSFGQYAGDPEDWGGCKFWLQEGFCEERGDDGEESEEEEEEEED
jgi:hypothetical protein